MNYHEGVLLFYNAGLQVTGDESLVLYSTITDQVITEIEGSEVDLGYGVGDFDNEYIYISNERSNSTEEFKGIRINRETNEIEQYTSSGLYVSYGYDKNQLFYQTQIADANVICISRDDAPTYSMIRIQKRFFLLTCKMKQ